MDLLNHTEEITVAASPEAVWALVSDLEAHPRLGGSGEVQSLHRLDDGPLRPGLQFEAHEVVNVGPKVFDLTVRSEVVRVEPGRLLVWHTTSPTELGKPTVKLIEWAFSVREARDGAVLDHSIRIVMTSAWVTPFFRPVYSLIRGRKVKRGMAETLRRISTELGAGALTP